MKEKVYDSDRTPQEDRNPPIFMPFLFNVHKKSKGYVKTLVCIARWDLSPYDHEWWGTPEDNLAGDSSVKVHHPDIDLVVEAYEFTEEDGNMGANGEREAIEFIRQWWIGHPVERV